VARAILATFSPSAFMRWIRVCCSRVTLIGVRSPAGLPKCLPAARATSCPARIRSALTSVSRDGNRDAISLPRSLSSRLLSILIASRFPSPRPGFRPLIASRFPSPCAELAPPRFYLFSSASFVSRSLER
jgi:hypothetical protein